MSKQTTAKTERNKLGRAKGGRPTKEQQLQTAIKSKNSAALEIVLTRIRLELFDLVAADSEGATKTADRARNLDGLKKIYDIGKAVLEDLKREEEANKQDTEALLKLLAGADDVTAAMGWEDE